MKKSFYSIGSIIILLLAAVIFVLIPAMSGVTEIAKLPDYGSYNGRPIRFEENSEFYNAANELIEYYEQQGLDFNSQQSSYYYTQIFNEAFNNTIGSYALTDFTKSTGYIVPDSAITRAIKKLDMFKDQTGTFSSAIYQSYSDPEKLKAQQNVELNLTQLRSYEDIFGSLAEIGSTPLYGLKSSSAEIEFVRKLGEKQYAFDAVAFDMKNYPDSEKEAFGRAHPDLFVKYNVKVISLDTESKAKEVLKRINNAEITFEDALTEYSTKHYGDPETGLLSSNYKFQLSNAVLNEADVSKIIDLAKDAISPVLETASSWCIFKCVDAPTQPDFSQELTLVGVYSYLLTREKSVIEDYYLNIAKDFVAKSASTSFKAEAEKQNLIGSSVIPFALNYGNTVLIGHSPMADDPILRYAVSNENFYKTAFKLKQGETSAPIVLSGANQVVVLNCSEIITGGTPVAEAKNLITPELNNASKSSINHSILSSDKVKNNSSAFMQVFNGNKS